MPGYKEPFGPPAIDTRHVSNTNPFRTELQGEALTAKHLLQEIEDAILEEGPDTIAVIIAEPVQNAGGCLVPPPGYWPGLRELADRYGILLHADEVITGFGRLGEWFGVTRFDATPDLITVAKGLTSAYAPMGAVLVSDKVAAPLYEDKRTLLHGITFGGHPLCAAIALKNLEIFEREGVLENVRAHEAGLQRAARAARRTCRSSATCAAPASSGRSSSSRTRTTRRFDADERERLLRGYMPRRCCEAGLIARADDRGDAVLQIAPPLISDDEILDEIVDKMRTRPGRRPAGVGARMSDGARGGSRLALAPHNRVANSCCNARCGSRGSRSALVWSPVRSRSHRGSPNTASACSRPGCRCWPM